jgi:hypothetical protein
MHDRISVVQTAYIRISTAAGRMQVSQPVAVAHISGIDAERLCGNGTDPFSPLGVPTTEEVMLIQDRAPKVNADRITPTRNRVQVRAR